MKIKKIGLIAVSAITLLGLTTTSTPILGANPIQEVQASDDSFVSDFRIAQINTINYIRTSNGLPALSRASVLDNYAQQRAESLAAQGQLDHHVGKDKSQVAPYDANSMENLALTQTGEGTAALSNASMQQFWRDPNVPSFEHRKTILNSYIDHVGVGVAKIAGNIPRYIVVQEYGIDKTSFDALVTQNTVDGYNTYVSNYNANGLGSFGKYTWDLQSGLASTSSGTTVSTTPTTPTVPTTPTNPSHSGGFYKTIGWYGDHTVTITGNSSDIHPLYSKDGKKSNRGLAGNTAWYTDQYLIDQNGTTYYRVSTNEWLPESSTTVFK